MTDKEKRSEKFEKEMQEFKRNIEKCFDDICASILIAIPPFGEIISVNLETEELTGYEASELVGMYLSDIFCEEDKSRINSIFEVSNVEKLDFRRLFEHNIIIKKRSKRKIIVDMGIKLKHLSEFTAFVFTLQDITDLKNSELETKKAHEYVNNILTSMTESVFVVDKNLNIRTVNRSALKLIGCQEKDIIHTSAKPLFTDPYLFENLTDNDEVETEITSKSGQKIPVLVLLSHLQSSKSDEGLKVVVAVDMTERKNAEKLIAEQQMMLVQSSKMSALGVMASGIAHEINNPLHIINGNCEILGMLLDQVPINAEDLKESIKVMGDMTTRIDEIIAGLSSFSRDESGDPPEMNSIEDIIKDTLLLCESRIQNAGISFILPTVGNDLRISCRATQISQVLLNLFNNAYDEVRDTEKPFIELKVEDIGEQVILRVINSGQKIRPEICESIFNPFYTTKPVGEGTGLGLSISKSIVESHFGKLNIDLSQEFTTFVVTLPKSVANEESMWAG